MSAEDALRSHATFPIVRPLTAEEARRQAGALGAVLADCVASGASVSFMPPFSAADGAAFFSTVADEVAAGRTIIVAALAEDRAIGTVQVKLAMPPNQPHRAEIAKLLVLRSCRGRGIGAALMRAAEEAARLAGKSLLCLDTAVGGAAERLYRALGWTECGLIPDFALWPDGRLCATRLFFKRLNGTSP